MVKNEMEEKLFKCLCICSLNFNDGNNMRWEENAFVRNAKIFAGKSIEK